jgi:hypothetical protein
MLADSGRSKENAFCLQLRQTTPGDLPSDLASQLRLQNRVVEFVLPQQRQAVADLQIKEVWQPVWSNALGAGCPDQEKVNPRESIQILPQQGSGECVPPGSVGAGPVKVGHLGENARWPT